MAPIPPTIGPVVAVALGSSQWIGFEWRGVPVTFNIYGRTSADFTVDPSETDHDTAIIDLLGWLGDLLRRSVTLIHENQPHYAILRYDPAEGSYAHPPWP